jgi:hypothetical protein
MTYVRGAGQRLKRGGTMSETIDQIRNAIYEQERENIGTDEWPVYVPHSMLDDVSDHIDDYSHQEIYKKGATVAGRRIIGDGLVDEPIALPENVSDLPLSHATIENAPAHLIEQVASVELKESTDWVRETKNYRTRLFFDVEDRHLRLNHDKIDKYNLSLQNNERTEYDRKPDELEQVKLGYSFTSEALEMDMGDFATKTIVDGVKEHIHSVHRQAVYGTRTRRFRFPYSGLDFTHQERIRCGTIYTHYGGVLLKNIDTPAQKMELPQGQEYE